MLYSLVYGNYYSYAQLKNVELKIKINTFFCFVLWEGLFLYCISDRVLLYNPGWMRTYCVAKSNSQTWRKSF